MRFALIPVNDNMRMLKDMDALVTSQTLRASLKSGMAAAGLAAVLLVSPAGQAQAQQGVDIDFAAISASCGTDADACAIALQAALAQIDAAAAANAITPEELQDLRGAVAAVAIEALDGASGIGDFEKASIAAAIGREIGDDGEVTINLADYTGGLSNAGGGAPPISASPSAVGQQ